MTVQSFPPAFLPELRVLRASVRGHLQPHSKACWASRWLPSGAFKSLNVPVQV